MVSFPPVSTHTCIPDLMYFCTKLHCVVSEKPAYTHSAESAVLRLLNNTFCASRAIWLWFVSMWIWKETVGACIKRRVLPVQRSRFEGRSFQTQVTGVAAAVTCSVCFYISGYHNILVRSQKRDSSVPYTKTICFGTAARGHVKCSKYPASFYQSV